LRLADRETDVVRKLANLVDGELAVVALRLGFAQLRIDFVQRLARVAEIGLDQQPLVELDDEALLFGLNRLGSGLNGRLQLLAPLR
jgi:hypothetical protein